MAQFNILDAALVFLPPRLIWIISQTVSGQPVATRRAGSGIVLFGVVRWVGFHDIFNLPKWRFVVVLPEGRLLWRGGRLADRPG